MKYCTKCGCQLADEAKFCNACGAPVETAESENPYASENVSYNQPVNAEPKASKTDEELRAEEQALLDKFSLGLKHERMAWKFMGVFYLISLSFIAAGALFIGLCAAIISSYDSASAYAFLTMAIFYFAFALIYLPAIIINLSMKKKLETYRSKLYTDCRDGIGHFSVGSIVFCAFFNGVALVFNIVYFIQAKNNAAVIERIKARQEAYNSQQ